MVGHGAFRHAEIGMKYPCGWRWPPSVLTRYKLEGILAGGIPSHPVASAAPPLIKGPPLLHKFDMSSFPGGFAFQAPSQSQPRGTRPARAESSSDTRRQEKGSHTSSKSHSVYSQSVSGSSSGILGHPRVDNTSRSSGPGGTTTGPYYRPLIEDHRSNSSKTRNPSILVTPALTNDAGSRQSHTRLREPSAEEISRGASTTTPSVSRSRHISGHRTSTIPAPSSSKSVAVATNASSKHSNAELPSESHSAPRVEETNARAVYEKTEETKVLGITVKMKKISIERRDNAEGRSETKRN